MKLHGKYYFMIFTVFMMTLFNYVFFTEIKKSNDHLISQYIIPQSSVANKERLQALMSQPYYLRSQIDDVNDLAFQAYKDILMKKDLVSVKIKNIMLLNMKIIFVDNLSFYFRINYLINLCLLASFLFAIMYKETNMNDENKHEPIFNV